LQNVEIITCDLKNIYDLSSIIERIKPNYVVHLAALPLANISNEYSQEAISSIVETTTNLLEILRRIKFKGKFIYTSSSMVYGEFGGKSVDENSLTNPISIYGSAKLAGEVITKGFCNSFGLKYSIIRPSAAYGPTDVNRRVVQIFLENAIKNKPIIIKGSSSKVDFTYVDDLVEGYKLVIKGNSRTLLELALIIKKHFPKVKIIKNNHEKGVPKRGTLNIIKAKKLLNFRPKHDLELGIKKYISYLLNK
jgi:nucleoside-diphosphate-sugar epimerase